MLLEAEERGICHGIELAPEVKLIAGGGIGTCGCGVEVRVPDEGDVLECEGCGARWRLSVVLQVERA
jgi:hypothetical protein